MTIEKELSDAAQHVAGGKLDKLPLNQLYYFMTVTRGMAELAEAEMKRRGAYPFPVMKREANR